MRIVIISSQEGFRELCEAACLQYKRALITIRTADTIGQGLDLCEQIEAELVLVDLTHNAEAALIAIQQLAELKGRLVVASLDTTSIDYMTRAIRAGAQEVLEQPVKPEEVEAILDKANRLLSPDTPGNPVRRGKLVVVFSSKGGVGKTTIACNLGVALANALGDQAVCLVDANQSVPNVAPLLDLRPDYWLRDALREYRRLDSDLLRSFLTRHKSGVNVLAHRSDAVMDASVTEDQICKILLVCKGTFDYTITDTFPLLTSLNLSIMDLADQILLVTEAVVPAVRTARYNLKLLKQAGYGPERIKVVINRYTKFKGNVTPEMVAETLEWPVETIIPYDVHTTIAANQGETVIEKFPGRPISDAFFDLAAEVAGRRLPPPEPASILARIARFFG